MNYDGMNVHQLMEKAVDVGTQYGHAVWKDGCEEMDALESALRKAVIREASVETCEWKENEDGMWDTSCENTFVFDEGGPEENEQKFCCYCGKPLKVVPFVYPTEEETT